MQLKLPNNNLFKDIRKNKYFQLMPDIKEERIQKYTTLILTLVSLSFFGIFAISPTVSTIAKLQKELEDNRFIDQQLKNKINNLSVLQGKYQELESDLPIVLSAIPEKPEIAALTGQVHTVMKETGINPSSFQVYEVSTNPKSKAEDYSSFVFGLSATGDFNSIKNFVSKIVNIDRIILINSIFINKKSQDEDLKLNFKGEAFLKK